ncbi:MAG: permease-like cell division protein FtsX [Flectobacillus sp.]|nr:permease-like cell division protein FtsX [Flectobacillus sp.]
MSKSKQLGNTPNLLVIVSLTIALLLIGLCGLLTLNARKLTELIKQNVELQVYLENDLSTSKLDSIFKQIASQDFVLLKDGSPQINFISKDVAAKQFVEESGEDYAKLLGKSNPLLNLYAVKVKPEFFNEQGLAMLKKRVEKIEGVHEVAYVENFVDAINEKISKIYIVLSAFVALLLGIILILVNNTIKLSLYSQRFLIRSMQLVGATNSFIRKPFVVKGALQGLTSGLIAATCLIISQQLALHKIEGLAALQEMDKIIFLLILIIILGVLIGTMSTFQSVERYLHKSLDDLYK